MQSWVEQGPKHIPNLCVASLVPVDLLPGRSANHSCPALLILLLQIKHFIQFTSFTSKLYIASFNSLVPNSKFPTNYESKMFVGETDKECGKNLGSNKHGGIVFSKTPSFDRITYSSVLLIACSLYSLVHLGSINLSSPCTRL